MRDRFTATALASRERRAVVFGLVSLLLVSMSLLAACTPTIAQRPVRIAFMSDRDGQLEIYLMERDGSNPVNLTNHDSTDGIPIWSPVANAFTFITNRDSDTFGLYRMDDQGNALQLLAMDPPANGGAPAWSPAGDWIAYGSGELDPFSGNTTGVDIYLMDPQGNNLVNRTESPSTDRFAAWSPDGKKFLFTSDRDGELGVYVMDLEGGDPTRLTAPETASATPTWSPDGTKIAYTSIQDEDIEIYVMDADGSNNLRLTDSAGVDAFPAWSPDGGKIAFLTFRDDNPEIYAMNPDGSEQVNLTNNPAQDAVQGDFSWSPDSTQILFHTDRDGNVEIYVMDASGENQTNLTNDPANDLASIWVP